MPKMIILKDNFPHTGKIIWLGLRQSMSSTVTEVVTAELLPGHGLVGDKAGQRKGSKRQVTLFQAEYLPVIASFLRQQDISPAVLRRNLVVSGINLSILKDYRLIVNNDVIVEITGNCAPCKKMEKALGYGGYNAMRNHGGVNAMVLKGGVIRVGDEVQVIMKQSHQSKLL